MATDEVKKKWGTIFMGNREASVEQLNAMQEPLRRERRQKDEAGDYMERVRARAADRAREILGAAYAERQKVLDEARADAAARKKDAFEECARLRAEGEAARHLAQTELDRAEAERNEAEKIRESAHDEGYKAGMEQAARELHEFRADLGEALGVLLRAIERQRRDILEYWREDLAILTQCAAQAGAGLVLEESQNKVLHNLVFQALDLLESRKAISLRVNPSDEAAVSDMFRAARERFPELGQWIVTGDEKIEKGGLVAESGSGSVDLRRENFREMVDGVLAHLALPEGDSDSAYENSVREIVEREVGRIASLTPEADRPEPQDPVEPQKTVEAEEDESVPAAKNAVRSGVAEPVEADVQEAAANNDEKPVETAEETGFDGEDASGDALVEEQLLEPEAAEATDKFETSLEELEEELFPLEGEDPKKKAPLPVEQKSEPAKNNEAVDVDPDTLAGGGFL